MSKPEIRTEERMIGDFKPIHFFNHSTNESFQIVTREGLIDWINDFTENHNAFDTYEELKERCLTTDLKGELL